MADDTKNDARLSVTIPALATERLALRAPSLEDFEASLAMWSIPDVVRYLGPTLSPEGVWTRLHLHIGQWLLHGVGFWNIGLRDSGEYLGEIGLSYRRRPLGPGLEDAVEIGWVLVPQAQGRGLATEAAREVLTWAHRRFERVVCFIEAGNIPSQRVAAKLGFAQCATHTYHGKPMFAYERFRGGSGLMPDARGS